MLRDVGLVGGAVYQRASSLGWKVRSFHSLYQYLWPTTYSFGNVEFCQWKSWSDFFNLDQTRPQKVEPLFISKVSFILLQLITLS